MTKSIRTLCLLFYCFTTILEAEIHETYDINEVRHYITPETLVIFDIDNTVIEPVQTIGSDQWFHYRIDYHKDHGYSDSLALETALEEWVAVQNITQVKEVQEGCSQLIADLQNEGYTVMGLTTRGLGMSTLTVRQLKRLDIDLSATAPTQEEVFLKNKRGVLFRGGILFTAGTHKGMALAKFLHLIETKPQHIVFINDKASHLKEVEVIADKYRVPFNGLRYGYTDEKVNKLNKEIADLQFEFFGHILSDHEAKNLLSELKQQRMDQTP